MNPKLIEAAWKGITAIGVAIVGLFAGNEIADSREEKRREKLLKEERLRHEKIVKQNKKKGNL